MDEKGLVYEGEVKVSLGLDLSRLSDGSKKDGEVRLR